MKVKNFVLKNKWWFVGGLWVLFIASGIAAFLFVKNSDVVATINGEQITKQQVSVKKPQYENFYKHSQDQYSLDNIDAVVKDKMIKDLIITSESAKRGISLTQNEIDGGYKERIGSYKTEENMLSVAKGAYGWDKEMILASVRTKLLEEKLKEQVIRDFDVVSLYVRYDYTNNETDSSILSASQGRIQKAREEILAGKTFDDVFSVLDRDPVFGGNNSGLVKNSALNEDSYKESFQNREEEWTAISKLNQGELTDIIKTSGGYYTFYKAEKVRNGDFATWEKFIENIKIKNNIEIGDSKKSLVEKILGFTFPGAANAHDGTFRACSTHKSAQKGYILDSVTWLGVAGATVELDAVDGAGAGVHVHDDANANYPANCEDRHETRTSHSTGYYRVGTTYTYVDGTGVTKTGPEYMDCVYGFVKTITKSGYETRNWTSKDLANGQTMDISYYLNPQYTLTVNITGAGSGNLSTGGGAINCDYAGAAKTCSYTYTYGYTEAAPDDVWVHTGLTSTPSANSASGSFSGACSGANCTGIVMNADRTVNASFNLRPPTCSLTGGGTVYRGSAATLSWSTANATSTSSSWSTSTTTSGSASVSPNSTTDYTLNVTGGGGSGSCTATVAVQHCGDGAQNGSESCDLGSSNGTCPATCSTSCSTNANSYALTYEDNTTDTVTGMPTATTFVTNVAKTLAPAPTRTGYTFNGWNRGSDGNGTNYNASTSATFSDCSAFTLYAKWTINTYTLTYDKNTLDSLTSPVPNTSTYNYNTSTTVSTTEPKRTGYDFDGWYLTCTTDQACTGTKYGKTPATTTIGPITGNITLRAKWKVYCLISCPTITSGATSTGIPCSYTTVVTDAPSVMNVTGSVTKGTPTWTTSKGTVSPTTGSPVAYTMTFPGAGSLFLTSTDSNCLAAATTVTASVKACNVSNIAYAPTVLGINSAEPTVNPTFTTVITDTLSKLKSRWWLHLGAIEKAKTTFNATNNGTWTRPISEIGNYTVKYEGLNGVSEFGTIPGETATLAELTPFGYCTASKNFTVVQTAYCKIKSTSGDAPLVLRVDADDNRAGASGEYIFTIKKADGSIYKTVNLPSAAGLVNLIQTIDLPGAYTVSVRRQTPAAIDPETPCKIINASGTNNESDTNNQINVTKPGTGSGGEVTPE